MGDVQQFRVEPLEEVIDASPDGVPQFGWPCVRRWAAFASFFADGGFTDITNYL